MKIWGTISSCRAQAKEKNDAKTDIVIDSIYDINQFISLL